MKKLHRPLPVKLLSLATALSLLLSLIIALTHPHLTSAVPTAAQTQSQPVPSPQDQSVNSTTNADGFTIQPNRGPARGGNDVTITPPKASSASCSCPEASRPLPIYQLDFGGVLIQPQDATIDPATLSWTVKAPQHAPAQVTVTAKYADQTWKTTPLPYTYLREYKVAFDLNGPTIQPPATQTVIEGEKAQEPPTPADWVGYQFLEWIESSTQRPWNFNTPVNKDIDLIARWGRT